MRWYLARAKDGYLAETASYFSASDADLVVVVEDGVISEFGSHERHGRGRGGPTPLSGGSWHGKA